MAVAVLAGQVDQHREPGRSLDQGAYGGALAPDEQVAFPGDRAAWFVAALTAVNPFVTCSDHETRMYSLVVLLGLVVAGFFVDAFVDGNRRPTWCFAGR